MAGPYVIGSTARKLATESPIVKRAEEKLTTSGAAKVLGQKAASTASKVAPAVGKVLPVLDLLLNSAPSGKEMSMSELKEEQKRKGELKSLINKGKEVLKERTEKGIEDFKKSDKSSMPKLVDYTPPAPKKVEEKTEITTTTPEEIPEQPEGAKVPEEVPSTVDEKVSSAKDDPFVFSQNVDGEVKKFEMDPKTGEKTEITDDGNFEKVDDVPPESIDDTPPTDKTLKPDANNPEVDETKKESEKDEEKNNSPANSELDLASKVPDYHNIISYYRTGGYGDPNTKQAKYNLGMAILDQLGKTANSVSNIAMANAGKAGTADTSSQFNKEQAASMQNDFEFRNKDKNFQQNLAMLQQEFKNNKEMQKQLMDLKKDFEQWTVKNGIEWGNDKEGMEALTRFVAARGNQNEAGGFWDTVSKTTGAAGAVAGAWALLKNLK